jgi:serine/threonine-protein kinase
MRRLALIILFGGCDAQLVNAALDGAPHGDLAAPAGSEGDLALPPGSDLAGRADLARAPDGGTTAPLTGCDSAGASPTAGPADLFPCDNPWYKDVSKLSVATGSATMIGAIAGWQKPSAPDQKLHIDFSMVLLHADSSTAKHTFTLDPSYDPDNDHDAVPVPTGGAVEGESGYACTTGGDCHLLVIDRSAHKLYELWQANIVGSSYAATQQSDWDLTKHYGPEGRGYGCTSADAGGLSIATGLIGVREVVQTGAVQHALRFTLPNPYIRDNTWVYPATHGTSSPNGASSTTGPPYGARLRLGSSAATKAKIAAVTSKGGKAIVAALQTYGMILADGSNFDTLIAEDDRLTKLEDPNLTWQGVLGPDDLAAFTASDFDVVDLGTTMMGDNCVRAP